MGETGSKVLGVEKTIRDMEERLAEVYRYGTGFSLERWKAFENLKKEIELVKNTVNSINMGAKRFLTEEDLDKALAKVEGRLDELDRASGELPETENFASRKELKEFVDDIESRLELIKAGAQGTPKSEVRGDYKNDIEALRAEIKKLFVLEKKIEEARKLSEASATVDDLNSLRSIVYETRSRLRSLKNFTKSPDDGELRKEVEMLKEKLGKDISGISEKLGEAKSLESYKKNMLQELENARKDVLRSLKEFGGKIKNLEEGIERRVRGAESDIGGNLELIHGLKNDLRSAEKEFSENFSKLNASIAQVSGEGKDWKELKENVEWRISHLEKFADNLRVPNVAKELKKKIEPLRSELLSEVKKITGLVPDSEKKLSFLKRELEERVSEARAIEKNFRNESLQIRGLMNLIKSDVDRNIKASLKDHDKRSEAFKNSISKRLSDSSISIEKKLKEIEDDIESSIIKISQTVSVFETKVKDFEKKQDEAGSKISGIEKTLNGGAGKSSSGLERKVSELEGLFENVKSMSGDALKRLDELERVKPDFQEKEAKELKELEELKELKESKEAFSREINALRSSIPDVSVLEKDMDAVKGKLRDFERTSAGTATPELDGLRSRVNKLEADLKTGIWSIEDLKSTIKDIPILEDKLGELKFKIDDSNESIKSLKKIVESAGTSETQKKIRVIESTIDDINENAKKKASDNSLIEEKLRALEEKMDLGKNDAFVLEEKLSALEERMNLGKIDTSGLDEKLRALEGSMDFGKNESSGLKEKLRALELGIDELKAGALPIVESKIGKVESILGLEKEKTENSLRSLEKKFEGISGLSEEVQKLNQIVLDIEVKKAGKAELEGFRKLENKLEDEIQDLDMLKERLGGLEASISGIKDSALSAKLKADEMRPFALSLKEDIMSIKDLNVKLNEAVEREKKRLDFMSEQLNNVEKSVPKDAVTLDQLNAAIRDLMGDLAARVEKVSETHKKSVEDMLALADKFNNKMKSFEELVQKDVSARSERTAEAIGALKSEIESNKKSFSSVEKDLALRIKKMESGLDEHRSGVNEVGKELRKISGSLESLGFAVSKGIATKVELDELPSHLDIHTEKKILPLKDHLKRLQVQNETALNSISSSVNSIINELERLDLRNFMDSTRSKIENLSDSHRETLRRSGAVESVERKLDHLHDRVYRVHKSLENPPAPREPVWRRPEAVFDHSRFRERYNEYKSETART